MATVAQVEPAELGGKILQILIDVETEKYKSWLFKELEKISLGSILERYRQLTFILHTLMDYSGHERLNWADWSTQFYEISLERQFMAKFLAERDQLNLIIENNVGWLHTEGRNQTVHARRN